MESPSANSHLADEKQYCDATYRSPTYNNGDVWRHMRDVSLNETNTAQIYQVIKSSFHVYIQFNLSLFFTALLQLEMLQRRGGDEDTSRYLS